MTRYSTTMSEILYNIREGYSPKQIKMAIGIASDKRYAGGNMTGAVNAIEKIKKGLSDHPQVAAVLKRQNEENDEPASPDEGGMATDQLEFMKYAAEQMMQHIQSGGEFPEWMQNKLSGTFEKMKSLYANIEHGEMKEGVEPIQWPSQPLEEELDLDEMKMDDPKLVKAFDKMKKGDTIKLKTSSTISKGKDFVEYIVKSKNVVNKGRVEKVTLVTKGNENAVKKFLYKRDGKVTFAIGDMGASIDDIKEGKSSTGYELYHKDFSSAMAHAYDFAKKKFGIEVDPKEIDDKVASGPRKPSKGKTNSYRLVGKDGKKAIQVQVYGMDNGKYELNMYKESVELEEKLKVSDGLGAWIDDFKKSDAPQFQGKSDEEKKNMAIAAFTDAGGKLEQKEETELDEKAPKMKYALVGKDMKIYSMGSDERDLKLDRRSLEQRFKDAAPLKLARLKTAQSIGDKVDKSQLKEEEEPNKPDSAKEVDKVRDDKKKTRIAQLQLQIAKASETINKLNAQEK